MSSGENMLATKQPPDALLALGRAIQVLKRVPRSGWLMRGVPGGEAENVAAHAYGVALIALALAQLAEEPLDLGRLALICLLHDLAEARVGDISAPSAAYLPAGAKQQAEEQALADLLDDLPFAQHWQALWQEYETGSTPEGRLARDADRLDMMLQAAAYEATGRKGLQEFWSAMDGYGWEFSHSATLWEALHEARQRAAEASRSHE